MLPSFPAVSRLTLRRLGLTALAAATLALSACGGGDRASDYRPDAILVFGDEHSALTTYDVGADAALSLRGATWSIDGVIVTASRICAEGVDCAAEGNALTPPDGVAFVPTEPPAWTYSLLGEPDAPRSFVLTRLGKLGVIDVQQRLVLTYVCTSNNWVQRVARSFGLGFRDETGCETDGTGGQNFAAPGKKVADVIADLNSQRSLIKGGALVTVMVGQHDILEEYETVKLAGYTAGAIDAAVGQLEARGRLLATAVKDVTERGAKVILVKTPNLGRSPFALAEPAGGAAALTRLSDALNNALYINPDISRLGRMIAGVDTDRIVKVTTSSSGYTNGQAACDERLLFNAADNTLVDATSSTLIDGQLPVDAQPRYCHTLTLKAGVNAARYVWATSRHLGTGAHEFIGSLAFNRASDQF